MPVLYRNNSTYRQNLSLSSRILTLSFFSQPKQHEKSRRMTPSVEALDTGTWKKIAFSTKVAVYLGNSTR